MATNVLIVSRFRDPDAQAVSVALRRRGSQSAIWYTSDFPALSRETFYFGKEPSWMRIDGPNQSIDGRDFDVVWNRRISFNPDYDIVHPKDAVFVEQQSRRFREGSLMVSFSHAYWVNPYDQALRSENKFLQLRTAGAVGLDIPETIFSNDPSLIRCFLSEHAGEMIYKPLTSATWIEDKRIWGCHTIRLTQDDLVSNELLAASPGIYQELIPKAFELRVTIIGCKAFAAKILSQESEHGKIDWRKAYDELSMERFELSEGVKQKCLDLMERLGLVFGCLDLVVTPDNRVVFLEINQMGQFLFLERQTGFPLLDAFTEFLLGGGVASDLPSRAHPISLASVQAEVTDLLNRERERHFIPPVPQTLRKAQ